MRKAHVSSRLVAALAAVVAVIVAVFASTVPTAEAQDIDSVLRGLRSDGYYIEPGAEGDDRSFADLVRRSESSPQRWYFASMAGGVDADFAAQLRDELSSGNVLVYYPDGEFVTVQLETAASEQVEDQALAPFDGPWLTPDEFMAEVVTEYDRLTAGSSSSGSSGSGSSESGSGGGAGWLWIAIPAVVIVGGIWFSRRGKRNKAEADRHEAAAKLRTELQAELDELANDVLVLSSPVDLSDNEEAVRHYREATQTYTDISDELPDPAELESADLGQLDELGRRVVHARWQMDAAEALVNGEPVPDKPEVEPPPPPPKPPKSAEARREPPRMPNRTPRPRTTWSGSSRGRRGGGGLLDILIAGAGMMAGGRRRGRGGMFGGSSRGGTGGLGGMFGGGSSQGRSRRPSGGVLGGGSSQGRSSSRRGGGVFGGTARGSSRGSGSGRSSRRSTSRTRSRSSSRSRSRSRAASTRRSTSRSRRRR